MKRTSIERPEGVVQMLTVRDVMKTYVIQVSPTTPLKDVAQLLVDRRISGVPVVDEGGAVVGVVSETDFLVKEQGRDAVTHRPMSRWLGDSAATRSMQSKLDAETAGAAMTSPAVTVAPGATIPAAARTMTEHRVNRLPVVEDGRLVGIVTRADLLRAYVRADGELESTIRNEVIRKLLWLDPSLFTIVVRDGIVSVSGRVELHSTADAIERSIAMVPGIINLHASVGWSVEDQDVRPTEPDPLFPFGPH
jgi:CBS domain-containing protein